MTETERTWKASIVYTNDECPCRLPTEMGIRCIHPLIAINDVKECTLENCPVLIPEDCRDCKQLYYNQNPSEPLEGILISTCGAMKFRIIYEAMLHEKNHYTPPSWCPKLLNNGQFAQTIIKNK